MGSFEILRLALRFGVRKRRPIAERGRPMGYQECFVLPQANQSALDLITSVRKKLNSFHEIECTGISIFTCSLNGTVYPESENYSVEKGQELVVSLGDRREQVDLFKELGLRWMYLDEIRGPEEIRGEDLFKRYEQYSEVSEG
jgi:hypothetical protein